MPTTSNQTERTPIRIRPTLILGLGGTGYKIVLQAKARLEEELGASSNYHKVVKYLVFDTANENFTIHQPNHPERLVQLAPEREFVRISDVPLHDLIQSRQTNPAIDAIFPPILQSTQIDQGAQQIRRLGRIALFYHYQEVRAKLKDVIASIRSIEVASNLGISEDGTKELFMTDNKRLRVFIACSICGGTGSGTFIDMAYMVRHIAMEEGIPSAVDVVGMLLLPEAFPEISTTGANRIRANAYAALLDLEYYNQSASANQTIYEVDMPGGEHIALERGPFSSCYLVGGSSTEGSAGGLSVLAPILGNAISTLVSSRLGEQTDATFDNVRTFLTNYHDGYRTFYSAIGVSEVVYPRLWMRQEFGRQMKRKLIAQALLYGDNSPEIQELTWLRATGFRAAVAEEARTWFDEAYEELGKQLRQPQDQINRITVPLQNLQEEIDLSQRPLHDLRLAYRQSVENFQRLIEAPISNSLTDMIRQFRYELTTAYEKQINRVFVEVRADNMRGGLVWTDLWLQEIQGHLDEMMRTLRQGNQERYADSLITQLIGQIETQQATPILGGYIERRGVVNAAGQLITTLSEQVYTREIDKARYQVLQQTLYHLERLQQQLRQTIDWWKQTLQQIQNTARPPSYAATTQPVFNNEELVEKVIHMVDERLSEHNWGGILSHLYDETGDLSAALDTPQVYFSQLSEFCEDEFSRVESSANVMAELLDTLSEQSRNSTLQSLQRQAEPLLVYNHGMLHGRPPSQIKVIGAETLEQGETLKNTGVLDINDLSVVQTNDTAKVNLLITHHGIPANALKLFETYRSHYAKMVQDPYAIFHMSEELENQPHDPGSAHFVNFADTEMSFALALATKGIQRLPNDNTESPLRELFAIHHSLYQELRYIFGREIQRIRDEVKELEDKRQQQETLKAWTEADERTFKQNRKTFLQQAEDLQQAFKSLGNVSDLRNFTVNSLTAGPFYVADKYSTDLGQLLLWAKGVSLPLMPRIFNDAVYNHMGKVKNINSEIDTFLNQQGKTQQASAFASSESPTGTSHTLMDALADLVVAYHRTEARERYNRDRRAFYADSSQTQSSKRQQKRS